MNILNIFNNYKFFLCKINISLLFLTLTSTSQSPIMTVSSSTFPKMSIFDRICIKNIFNSFLYKISTNCCNRFNQIKIEKSNFINILNTAIYITNLNFTNIIYGIQTVNEAVITQDSCFSNCTTTDITPNGGALYINQNYGSLNCISTVFTHCSSKGFGGAIASNGDSITINSCIFYQCQSGDTGMTIFYNKDKFGGASYFAISFAQSRFSNNEGKHDLLDLNCSTIECTCCNLSYNTNREHNQPSSPIQFCVCLPLLAAFYNNNFRFNNLVSNNGDCLVSINEKLDYSITYHFVNFIENFNLNYYFQFLGKVTSNIHMEDFLFYRNKPYSVTDGISISNRDSVDSFVFTNCQFDKTEEQVKSILGIHSQTGGKFEVTIGQGKGETYTFEYAYSYTKPSQCFVPDEVLNFGTDYFTDNEVLTQSYLFSPSLTFSPSLVFSKSSYFSSSESFTSSKSFSPSSDFTKSSIITQSSPFTPSHPFTPSFTFSPERTKVPDRPNDQVRAEISGISNIFSKEELKKVAAPASISLVLIIVSIVFSVFYISRRVRMLRDHNYDNFDFSYDESNATQSSEYSYSYYTYTYTYATSSSNGHDDSDHSDDFYSSDDSYDSNNSYGYFSSLNSYYSQYSNTQNCNSQNDENKSKNSFKSKSRTKSQVSFDSQQVRPQSRMNSQPSINSQSQFSSQESIDSQNFNFHPRINSKSRINSQSTFNSQESINSHHMNSQPEIDLEQSISAEQFHPQSRKNSHPLFTSQESINSQFINSQPLIDVEQTTSTQQINSPLSRMNSQSRLNSRSSMNLQHLNSQPRINLEQSISTQQINPLSRIDSQASINSQWSYSTEYQPNAIKYLKENTDTDDYISDSDYDSDLSSILDESSSDGKSGKK